MRCGMRGPSKEVAHKVARWRRARQQHAPTLHCSALLRAALPDQMPRVRVGGPTTRWLVERTKEFLDAEFANPISLGDIGQAVGAWPA